MELKEERAVLIHPGSFLSLQPGLARWLPCHVKLHPVTDWDSLVWASVLAPDRPLAFSVTQVVSSARPQPGSLRSWKCAGFLPFNEYCPNTY